MKNLSILSRFSLLVALVSVPFTAYIVTNIYLDTQRLVEDAQRSNRVLAEVAAGHLNGVMADVLKLANELAARPEMERPGSLECNRVLADFTQLHVGFLGASFNDAQGIIRCLSSSPNAPPPPTSIADLEWFLRLKAERQAVVSRPYLGRIQKRWLAITAVPVNNRAGEWVGSVVIPLDLSQLLRGIDASLPEGTFVTVVDDSGVVVTRSPDFEQWVGTQASGAEIINIALQQRDGVGRGASVAGVDSLVGFSFLPELGWHVIVGGDADKLLLPAQRRLWTTIGIGSSFIALTLLFALAFAMPLIRPIRALAAMTRTLAKGKLDVRFPEQGAAELVELARDFNVMASSLQEAQAALRASEMRFRLALQNSPILVFTQDRALRYTWVHNAHAGFSSPRVVGMRDEDLLPEQEVAQLNEMKQRAIESRCSVREEVRTARDGRLFVYDLCVEPDCDDAGQIVGVRGVAVDITARKYAEDEIKNLAFFDSLTGLPNRRMLFERLRQAVATSGRTQKQGALLFVDLDNFKVLNDTRGHDVGDLLLQDVGRRLQSCVRETDTVARLGGDEFVVMLESLSESPHEAAGQARVVGRKILNKLNEPYHLIGSEHHSTPSMGITLFGPQRESSPDDLLKEADLAMYQAKADGRNGFRFFDPEMQKLVLARASLEADLRRAVGTGQFVLHYQPQVASSCGVVGAEALLRWNHPIRGTVSPLEFIPLAEEDGLIVPLGHWVLEAACQQLVAWQTQPRLRHLSLAVNVSPRQFCLPGFVDEVLHLLEYTGADPRKLKLELTENLLLKNAADTVTKMNALKAHGVEFSLDDFGTGYSSLTYLKRLPLAQLKIDQSFVRDILVDPNDAAIAAMIVTLANSLGIAAVAEGVEETAQRDLLAQQGCHTFQGYLFSRPLPVADFEAFVMLDASR